MIFRRIWREHLETIKIYNKNIQFKGSKKIARESEMPIGRRVGDFEEKKYLCCDKVVKLRTTTKFEGGYCPFCGELVDGD